MDDTREAVETLLAEKPESESALKELLTVDEDGSWTFDDISIDSGLFDELVSRGIVQKTDGEYRLADRGAVVAVLDGSEPESESDAADAGLMVSNPLADMDLRLVAAVGLALLFVAMVRTVFIYDAVFRNGHVVLASNDPYRRLFWVERLIESDLQAFDVGALSNLPEPLTDDDTLMIVSVWWFAALLGGGQAPETAVAVYPVFAGVATAFLTYLLAVEVTDDRRIGLAAIVLLGVTPVHAFRTALGFGDHHAFDYVFLLITAYGVVRLSSLRHGLRKLGRRDYVAVLSVAIGITGQVHAWRGGPLLIVPIAMYAAVVPAIDLRAGRDPHSNMGGFMTALAIGAVLSWGVHDLLGWSPQIRAVAPALVLGFAIAMVGTAAAIDRLDFPDPTRFYLLSGTVASVGAVVLAWVGTPGLSRTANQLSRYFGWTGQSNIAETVPLFGGELGTVLGPLSLFGLILFLAFPYMGWAVYRAYEAEDPSRLALAAYGWYFFVLTAALQVRFAAQLSMFAAVFAGLGFVHLAERIDVAEPPDPFETTLEREQNRPSPTNWSPSVPDRDTIVPLVVLLLLVGGLSLALTPIKMDQIDIDDSSYQTGAWLEKTAADDPSDKSRYVFSNWGRNRFYNYMIGTDYRWYGYAQNNYETFIFSSNASNWATRLRERNAYVVTTPVRSSIPPESLQVRLHRHLGSASDDSSGVGPFKLRYVSPDGSRKVFEPTTTATITGQAEPNSTITVSTDVTVPGASFEYERRVTTTENGWYSVDVPYNGTYDTPTGEVTLSQRAIESERVIIAPTDGRPARDQTGAVSRHTFDLRHPSYSLDSVGAHHGSLHNVDRTSDAAQGDAALTFRSNDSRVHIDRPPQLTANNDSFTVSFAVKGDFRDSTDTYPTVLELWGEEDLLVGVWGRTDVSDFGARIGGTQDQLDRNFGIKDITFESWTHIVITHDAARDELRLYVDGQLVSTTNTRYGQLPPIEAIYIGSSPNRATAPVSIDDVRFYNRSLSNESVTALSNKSIRSSAGSDHPNQLHRDGRMIGNVDARGLSQAAVPAAQVIPRWLRSR